MSAAVALLVTPSVQLAEQIARLRADARNAECTGCRSADLRDCQAGPVPCCPDCKHTMSAADIATRASELLGLLDKLDAAQVRHD